MALEVISQSLTIDLRSSKNALHHGLVISFREWSNSNPRIIVGAPGQSNVVRLMQLGDAILYESATHGLIEVRLTEIRSTDVVVLVTLVSPRLGFSAGFDEANIENSPFSQDELKQIGMGLESIRVQMSGRNDLEPATLDLLSRKLDEIASAAQRMGRKDWKMFVAGTLTNVIVGAAFAPEAARALLLATNGSLGWIFQNAMRLLSM